MSNNNKRKTGTREWADYYFNIGLGCRNNCLYCYAKTNALKSGKISSLQDWTNERLTKVGQGVDKGMGKVESFIMYPTLHDITPYYLKESIVAIRTMLEKGNKVLVVSKPHLECIHQICNEFNEYPKLKENILFRFTIGSSDNRLLKFWEPNAPLFEERFTCLRKSFNEGYKTSVSMEPFLGDIYDCETTFKMLSPYVTDKIWIGKMNKISKRVKDLVYGIELEIEEINKNQTKENILKLVDLMKDNPKVEWKDSIKEIINITEKELEKQKSYFANQSPEAKEIELTEIEDDQENGVSYIRLNQGEVCGTKRFQTNRGLVLIDFDKDNNVLGIEII